MNKAIIILIGALLLTFGCTSGGAATATPDGTEGATATVEASPVTSEQVLDDDLANTDMELEELESLTDELDAELGDITDDELEEGQA